MNYKILIVEDDDGIAKGIEAFLNNWSFDTHIIADFRNILREFDSYKPHLILLDISLPYMNGYYWCSEIRKVSNVPIIFISSASDNMNIVMAMNMGADDFISKPFDSGVLVAKIQAILRRAYSFKDPSSEIEYNGARLNTENNSFSYNSMTIDLTKNEFKILLVLMSNINKTVSREKLMEALWKTDSFVDENTLTVNIGRLRKKLDEIGLQDFIHTKFGVGYIIGDNQ